VKKRNNNNNGEKGGERRRTGTEKKRTCFDLYDRELWTSICPVLRGKGVWKKGAEKKTDVGNGK